MGSRTSTRTRTLGRETRILPAPAPHRLLEADSVIQGLGASGYLRRSKYRR